MTSDLVLCIERVVVLGNCVHVVLHIDAAAAVFRVAILCLQAYSRFLMKRRRKKYSQKSEFTVNDSNVGSLIVVIVK